MNQLHNNFDFLINNKLGRFTHIPVTLSLSPTRHPKIPAKSPTIAVKRPIIPREQKKQSQPPAMLAGGINAKII